jgi:ACS family hexuronate transporter-like MFS transporter
LHGEYWHWWVSGLLLLATMINYMDRQTLSNLAVRVQKSFNLTEEQYGDFEVVFGLSFALGSLFFGIIADRVSIRTLYPLVLVAWSAVGIATGLTTGYRSMLICRGLLGFFEAGHWPCALIVTQAVMTRSNRAMGNSVLQSGASLGAILTPLIIVLMVGKKVAESQDQSEWRLPFIVIGGVGLLWAVLWLISIRPGDLTKPEATRANEGANPLSWLIGFLRDRRFWALAVMVFCINTSWQLIRAWLPKFLQQGRGYAENEAWYFNSAYFIATDVGCILAGAATLWLVSRGTSVHRGRVLVYAGCAALASLTSVASFLPHGWPLLGILLLVAAGTLGVFPCYYSFTQELSTTNMGKLTGVLSFLGWMSSPVHKYFGRLIDQTKSFDLGIALVGWAPLAGLVIFLLLWPKHETLPAPDLKSEI